MPVSVRFFLCARCRCQVHICPNCDTGQHYCVDDCSACARRERQREANRRYSRTRRARVLNAQRQHRLRLRRAAHNAIKVTDQTSALIAVRPPSHSIALSASRSRLTGSLVMPQAEVVCQFCHRVCCNRVRLDFLNPAQRRHHIHRSLPDP